MFKDFLTRISKSSDEKMRRTLVELAADYDDKILEFETVPDEAVDFLVAVFSDGRVLNSQGIEHFLLEMNVDFCKYTTDQHARILAVLSQNIAAVRDELARHSIGDFIARAYSPEVAYEKFAELSRLSNREVHVAFVGLDILRRRVSKDDPIFAKIEKRWNELLLLQEQA